MARILHRFPEGLAHVLLDINRDFEHRGAEVDERPSLVLWADLLRVVPDEGISVGDLPAAARISRRALKAWLTGLEKSGWLEVTAAAPRLKVVRLSAIGQQARDGWDELVVDTEQEWPAKVGDSVVTTLRDALEAFVRRIDVELPHYPMVYGFDPSAIGGFAVVAKPGPPRIPAHGTDWVPVVRSDDDTVSGLLLHALVSQALMAFTIDYEEQAGFPMSVAALLTEVVPDGSLPLRDVPPILGVNGSGKTLLERHGVVQVVGTGKDRVATLTPTGLHVRDAYEPTVARVTDTWRARYGAPLVDDLTAALQAVDDRLPADLPEVLCTESDAIASKTVQRMSGTASDHRSRWTTSFTVRSM